MRHVAKLVLTAGIALMPGALQAQDAWPSRTITLIVPYASGGYTDLVGRLTQRRTDPRSMALLASAAAVYGDSAYGRPPSGYIETVAKLTVGDVKSFHDRHFRPNNAVLVVVGDITADDLTARAASLFGLWKPRAVEAVTPAAPVAQPLAVDFVDSVRSLAFSPDGNILAAGYDAGVIGGARQGGVLLWDVPRRSRFVAQPLATTEGSVSSVAFTPDGKTLVAGIGGRPGVALDRRR